MDIYTPADVDLERKLLDPSNASCELDEDTLQQLAHLIGDKWASIAALLSFTTTKIEQFRSEDCPASAMLQKLKDNGTLTHEQICRHLQTISLLSPIIWAQCTTILWLVLVFYCSVGLFCVSVYLLCVSKVTKWLDCLWWECDLRVLVMLLVFTFCALNLARLNMSCGGSSLRFDVKFYYTISNSWMSFTPTF